MVRVGVIIVVIAAFAALAGPFLCPYDPSVQELARRLEAPTLAHPLGLDELGRDILARLLQGARISLLVGIAVVSVSSVVGMVFGSMAGYFGGRVDDVISRVIDVLMAFPGILLAIALVAVLGPSLVNVVLALSIIGWVGYARLVRGQALRAPAARAPRGLCSATSCRQRFPQSWCKPRWAWRAPSSPRRP